jgi:hypothetical protein
MKTTTDSEYERSSSFNYYQEDCNLDSLPSQGLLSIHSTYQVETCPFNKRENVPQLNGTSAPGQEDDMHGSWMASSG